MIGWLITVTDSRRRDAALLQCRHHASDVRWRRFTHIYIGYCGLAAWCLNGPLEVTWLQHKHIRTVTGCWRQRWPAVCWVWLIALSTGCRPGTTHCWRTSACCCRCQPWANHDDGTVSALNATAGQWPLTRWWSWWLEIITRWWRPMLARCETWGVTTASPWPPTLTSSRVEWPRWVSTTATVTAGWASPPTTPSTTDMSCRWWRLMDACMSGDHVSSWSSVVTQRTPVWFFTSVSSLMCC